MKGRLFILIGVAVISMLFQCSCTKNEQKATIEMGKIHLKFQISEVGKDGINLHSTKGIYSDENVLTQAGDNTINTIDILVFSNNSASPTLSKLDMIKTFTSADLLVSPEITITTSSGEKMIYAVANSHGINWNIVKTLGDFNTVFADLSKENLNNFTMVGHSTGDIKTKPTSNIVLSRIISRIKLNSLSINFSNTVHSGKKLTDVKIYMINVNKEKLLCDGITSGATILNRGGLIPSDMESLAINGMLYDNVGTDLSDGERYSSIHTFHCYENTISSESIENKFTRLVIEGKIDGTSYYYPISINREGFGYTSGAEGIEKNTCYSLSVTILREGSSSPDIILDKGTVNVVITSTDWKYIDNGNIEF